MFNFREHYRWIYRSNLKQRNVNMLAGVLYEKIDDEGLHILVQGQKNILDVDHIVICAGQVSNNTLYEQLQQYHQHVHLIGGALEAGELDAKRAILQGTQLALSI